ADATQLHTDGACEAVQRAETAEAEVESLRARVKTLEHVAAGNKRHVQSILPDLWAAQAAVDRVRDVVNDLCGEPHPGHDHICPNDIRRYVLDAIDGPVRPQPEPALDDTDGHDWNGSRDPWICRNCHMEHRRWYFGRLTGKEGTPCPGPQS
ncbi:hypothetical protein ACF1GQ_28900, partial [Streptomyces fradiae]